MRVLLSTYGSRGGGHRPAPGGGRRASIGLPPVDDVRNHVFTDHPLLAADPVLGPWQRPADLGVVQTGAWILPDERPLPREVSAFLDAGQPPVYVGFGSMPMRGAGDVARVAIEAVRAQRHRVMPATRARAAAVAREIRTDGSTLAATLLLDAASRNRRFRSEPIA